MAAVVAVSSPHPVLTPVGDGHSVRTMSTQRQRDEVGVESATQAPRDTTTTAVSPPSAPTAGTDGTSVSPPSVPPPAAAGAGGATGATGSAGAAGATGSADATGATTSTSTSTTTPPAGGPGDGREDVRIAMIGNVDSGKSTLVGCLTRATLDDGRGSARASVFRHRHERENGRTSSVGVELMGFNTKGQVVADAKVTRSTQWREIARKSTRSVTLIDLCGHEKYLKTTVFGLTGMLPDYGLVVVGANMGVSMMTKEHVGIAAALRLPMMVVVTKIDIAPKKVYKRTLSSIGRALKACGRKPFMVRSDADVATAADAMGANRIAPVICLSNVTGEGMSYLKTLLQTLPVRSHKAKTTGKVKKSKKKDKKEKKEKEKKGVKEVADGGEAGAGAGDGAATTDTTEGAATARSGAGAGAGAGAGGESAAASGGKKKGGATSGNTGKMLIDSVFQVPGVGCVVAGMVVEGEFRPGETYMLGPDSTGSFQPVTIRSIHVHYTPVDVAPTGRSAALAIRPKKTKKDKVSRRTWVRKGMTVVGASNLPKAFWEFEADIAVLHHQTTLSVGYAPTMHCGVVSQTARIISIKTKKGKPLENLRTGDRATVRCRFMYRPEHIVPGTILLFREGRAKGVGRIKRVFESKDSAPLTKADIAALKRRTLDDVRRGDDGAVQLE